MCGIAAIWNPRGSGTDPKRIEEMLGTLRHRGPDDQGHAILDGGRLCMGANRLAIVDLEAPPQPYFNEDRSVAAVVNGELYDHIELARDLRSRGHRLRTGCDSELLVHLYEERGLEFADELDGDFALVLWDTRKRRLLAARDRMGVRPLHWRESRDGELSLASEAKALLAIGAPRKLSSDYLCGPMLGAYDGRACAFDGIEVLPPGALMWWGEQGPKCRYFWRWSLDAATAPAREDSRCKANSREQALRAALETAVERRLRTEVPVGLLFSGGLDSAVVAALARQRVDLPAFCIRFPEPKYDESALAAAHAKALDLDLEFFDVSLEDLASGLPQTIEACELAPINAHGVARRLLSKHLRSLGIKVVLTGEGSDELFAGYPFFIAEARWRSGRRQGSVGVHDPATSQGLLTGDLQRASDSLLPWASFLEQRARRSQGVPAWAFASERREGRGPVQRLSETIRGHVDASPFALSRSLALYQLQDYLIPALGDRMEMAHGVEGRPVFLDRAVIKLANSCTEAELLDLEGGSGKQLLRRAVAGLLPASIANVPKHPFVAPSWRKLLATPSGRALEALYLSRSAIVDFGIFDAQGLCFVLRQARRQEAESEAGRVYDRLIGLALGVHLLMDKFSLR